MLWGRRAASSSRPGVRHAIRGCRSERSRGQTCRGPGMKGAGSQHRTWQKPVLSKCRFSLAILPGSLFSVKQRHLAKHRDHGVASPRPAGRGPSAPWCLWLSPSGPTCLRRGLAAPRSLLSRIGAPSFQTRAPGSTGSTLPHPHGGPVRKGVLSLPGDPLHPPR